MLFDDFAALGRVALVAVCAYAGLILVLRISGKRSLAKLDAFDFVVTVAFGSTLATVILSDRVSLASGLLAFAMLAGLQFAASLGVRGWAPFRRLVRSAPRLLFDRGTFDEPAMRQERVTRSDIEAAIRKQGVGRIEDVAAVVLETDGSFSVIAAPADAELTALGTMSRSGEIGR